MMMHADLLIIALVIIAAPVRANDEDRKYAVSYLRQYGYLGNEEGNEQNTFNETQLSRAIELFQEFYDISEKTGMLNSETIRIMNLPRCGVKDLNNRYFAQSSIRWPRTNLTWNFKLASDELLRLAKYAFIHWESVSALTFTRNSDAPDILISLQSGIHPLANRRSLQLCNSTFDGRGNILAHAYFPTGSWDYVSEIHIDEAEDWYIPIDNNIPPGYRHLLQTLVHEIGHSLGLQHSTRNDSVMFPIAPSESYPVYVSIEDRINIQNLYGVKSTTISPTMIPTDSTIKPVTEKSIPPTLDLCALKRVDAILIMKQRILIAYRLYLWSIDFDAKSKDTPILLTDYMTFLPRNFTRVSAAYQRPSNEIVLFAENKIYVIEYPSLTLRTVYALSDIGLPSSSKVNAAFNTHTGRSFVLYNDDRVAEIDECAMKVSNHYSLKLIFPGVPTVVRSAFRHVDGNLYFIGKREYYKFNEFEDTVKSSGKYDLSIVGITCPREGLLMQLRRLLDRLARIGETETVLNKDDNDVE